MEPTKGCEEMAELFPLQLCIESFQCFEYHQKRYIPCHYFKKQQHHSCAWRQLRDSKDHEFFHQGLSTMSRKLILGPSAWSKKGKKPGKRVVTQSPRGSMWNRFSRRRLEHFLEVPYPWL